MKKIGYLLALLGIFIFPMIVNAADLSITISCPGAAKLESAVSCKITGSSTETISNLSFNYGIGTALSKTAFTFANSFNTKEDNNSSVTLSEPVYTGKEFDIATLNLKLPKTALSNTEYTISINDIVYNTDNHATNVSDTIRVMSSVNSLSSLKVMDDDEDLLVGFKSNIVTYSLTVNGDVSSVNIEGQTTDQNATITAGSGSKSLAIGLNTVAVNVKSESGETRTYTLKITRLDNRSSNTDLATLSLSSGELTPTLSDDVTTYTATVDRKVTSLSILATLVDDSASFVTDYGPRTVILNEGVNEMLLKVKAENDTEKTYTIVINRGVIVDDNAYLKSLTISVSNILFTKDNYNYTANVENSVEEVVIEAIAESPKAKVVLDGEKELEVGTNLYTITVTSEKGTTKQYFIKIVRADENGQYEIAKPRLISLLVEGYDLSFNSEVFNYNLTIKNESELIILATPLTSTDTITIIGNGNLENGSEIKINVINSNDDLQTYLIKIKKEPIDAYTLGSIIFCGISFVIFITSLVAIIIKSKKK